MKIRPIRPQPVPPASLVIERVKQCNALVHEYYKARQEHNAQAAHSARLGISLFVPGGVYKRADSDSNEHYAVYGVIRSSTKLVSPERIFVVPVIPIKEVRGIGEFDGKWKLVPLIDTEGFLTPVCKDGVPFGPRFVRVGEVVHY